MIGFAIGEIRVFPARETSLANVNQLIARSKAYWSWPDGYLENALPLQQITTKYLLDNACFEVVSPTGDLLAFVSVVETGSRVLIDNFWVTPEHIRRGIGRVACNFVFRLARVRGWSDLWVLPDPPAEGFYRALGFLDTGERVHSRVVSGPIFSVFCRPMQADLHPSTSDTGVQR